MQLAALFQDASLPADVQLRGLADDSRRVRAGDLFCAYPGDASDGRRFVAKAAAAGALALAAEPPAPAGAGLPVVEVKDLRQRLGPLAARFHGQPSARMQTIAVTGTNGKTSFAHFLAQALRRLWPGKCALIGTLGYGALDDLQPTGLTTPGALDMQRILAELADAGFDCVALEASSHGLAQGRLNGVQVDLAVLTNVSRDHLDYHKSQAAYEDAKASLFRLPSVTGRVVNLDDALGARLAREPGKAITYSRANQQADVFCTALDCTPAGMAVRMSLHGREVAFTSPLLGEFNALNLLAVAATLHLLGLAGKELAEGLAAIKAVPGRMNLVQREGLPPVLLDYAHTPDGLDQCLAAAARHFPGSRITCVFGCGGERDKGKRPLMGRIAERHAAEVILTSDNPRNEPPEQILEDIAAGMKSKAPLRIPDRRAAIEAALKGAGAGGMLVLAGKGHEQFQLVAGEKRPFSDLAVLEDLAANEQGGGN